jgi:hypothetical protein
MMQQHVHPNDQQAPFASNDVDVGTSTRITNRSPEKAFVGRSSTVNFVDSLSVV